MLLIQKRCASSDTPHERLVLPFDLRQKSRLRTHLESGEEVGLFLERGTVLRGGDCLQSEDGRIVQVVAAPEAVYQVTCATLLDLTRAAYHLGNRHVPLQVGDNWLRLGADGVLKDMLIGLGAQVIAETVPFEPEAGAYGGGHKHGDESAHGGIIHHFGQP